MAHLKRHSMPKFWPLGRKEKVWAVKSLPGPHSKKNSIPLLVILRDVLKYADTAREAKSIISRGSILVDGVARKKGKFPVGFMDVIQIPETNEHFRMMIARRKILPQKIPETESKKKTCKIIGKRAVSDGKMQLNLHDGRNILADNNSYALGDSIIMEIPEQKILKHLKFAKGSEVIVVSGRNMGVSGKIKEINHRKSMLEKSTVILETDGGEVVTPEHYVFVTSSGKEPAEKKDTAKKQKKEHKPMEDKLK